jgi:hypothetical protein
MKRFAERMLVAIGLAALAPLSLAIPITYTAQLSGPAEAPPNDSPGTGFATVIFDSDAETLSVSTTFSGLLGTTTVAHIHCCTADPFAGTAPPATQVPSLQDFPVGVSAGTYTMTFPTDLESTWNPAFIAANNGSLAEAVQTFAEGLSSGRAYFNIHTDLFPPGEIRGFLELEAVAVPAPGSLGLLAAALLGFAAVRARRSSNPYVRAVPGRYLR